MLKNPPRGDRRVAVLAATSSVAAPAVAVPEMRQGRAPRRRLLGMALSGLGIAIFSGLPQIPVHSEANAVEAAILPQHAAAATGATASAADRAEWAQFRARFITAEGRVVDTGNGNVSHSEGQGYALLLAEWCNDRATFEQVLAWTKARLSRPSDALFAWRWKPGQEVAVEDMNSASDGDLGIAWALQRAALRWGVPEWQCQAQAIARAVLALSTREVAGRILLLPGPRGFERPGKVVVNPSYYLFPAMRSLVKLVPDARWSRLEQDGLWLLGAARFGRWGLSADWVEVAISNGAVSPATGWPARFSWDAVRVPLYLVWAGEQQASAVTAAAAFWGQAGASGVPAWADLGNGQLAPYQGHVGIQAVAALSRAAVSGQAGALRTAQAEAPDYYAASLALLSRMAWQEAGIPAGGGTVQLASR